MDNKNGKMLIISGEDAESGEEDEFDRTAALLTYSNNSNKNNTQIVTGEAPESEEDFGSTVSLDSTHSTSSSGEALNNTRVGESYLTSFLTAAHKLVDNSLSKKHRERNKNLRYNISEKFLRPVIANNIKKIDKLSQNLSNSEMQLQDALFQTRLTTTSLLKLQKEFESLNEANYLNDIKPSVA